MYMNQYRQAVSTGYIMMYQSKEDVISTREMSKGSHSNGYYQKKLKLNKDI